MNGKVFYTGGGKGKSTAAPRIDGNVLYCTGRPDMCQEIKNVILKKRPPQWMAAPANGTTQTWFGTIVPRSEPPFSCLSSSGRSRWLMTKRSVLSTSTQIHRQLMQQRLLSRRDQVLRLVHPQAT